MNKGLIFGAALLFAVACGSNNNTETSEEVVSAPVDSLFQQVMDGHDAAMAKMGKLKSYRKQFDQKVDSLKKVKSSAKKELSETYTDISKNLKAAEDRMNKWMEEFSIDSATDDVTRRLKYLSDEKLKVDSVRDEIVSVLSKADSLLKK
jgi:uncharacterized UPF0160 family protein